MYAYLAVTRGCGNSTALCATKTNKWLQQQARISDCSTPQTQKHTYIKKQLGSFCWHQPDLPCTQPWPSTHSYSTQENSQSNTPPPLGLHQTLR